jgi:hypothetical protein
MMNFPSPAIAKTQIVTDSQIPENDIKAGDVVLILGEKYITFDTADPIGSRDLVYECLVGDRIEHLFPVDLEIMMWN